MMLPMCVGVEIKLFPAAEGFNIRVDLALQQACACRYVLK